jgi:hypothetical protein
LLPDGIPEIERQALLVAVAGENPATHDASVALDERVVGPAWFAHARTL